MAQTGDAILVYFLSSQTEGLRFLRRRNDWPLHITLVPWFSVPDSTVLQDELWELSARLAPQMAVLGDEAQFNPETRATLVEDADGLQNLHEVLLGALLHAGAELRNAEWTGSNYKPHVTHHENQPVPKHGQLLDIRGLSLVRLLPDNMCEVVRTFALRAVA